MMDDHFKQAVFEDYGSGSESYSSPFRDFEAEAAAQKVALQSRIREAQTDIRPVYDDLKKVHLVYDAFESEMHNIKTKFAYSGHTNLAAAMHNQMEVIKKFAQRYAIYRDTQAKESLTRSKELADLTAHHALLQQIANDHGETLRAFAGHISDVMDTRFSGFEKVIVERLSAQNTDITDLIAALTIDRPSGWSFLFSESREKAEDIDIRIARLQNMVAEYLELAPVLQELGYSGENYNEMGRNGDIRFAIPNILREIRNVPERLQELMKETNKKSEFRPHILFRAQQPCHCEANIFLTREQRELMSWVQKQNGTIDEQTVSRALSAENIQATEAKINQWKDRVARILSATTTNQHHFAARVRMDDLLTTMDGLFSLSADNLDKRTRVDWLIDKAMDAKGAAETFLTQPLLTAQDAISILREIDPRLVLTGILKDAESVASNVPSYVSPSPS